MRVYERSGGLKKIGAIKLAVRKVKDLAVADV